jgi:hypothetical protein
LHSHGKSERSRAPTFGALVDPLYRSAGRPPFFIAPVDPLFCIAGDLAFDYLRFSITRSSMI